MLIVPAFKVKTDFKDWERERAFCNIFAISVLSSPPVILAIYCSSVLIQLFPYIVTILWTMQHQSLMVFFPGTQEVERSLDSISTNEPANLVEGVFVQSEY